jgi:hypothetical protein
MKLADDADRVATRIYHQPLHPWRYEEGAIRDAADLATYSALTTLQLDRLCDMIHKRLHSDNLRWQRWRLDRMFPKERTKP